MADAQKWRHTALLVLGMQNDFVLEDGPFRAKYGKTILPNVVEAVEVARKRGMLVVWNDFVLEDGAFRAKYGKTILPNVVEAVEVARKRGMLVVWVVREHDPQGRDVELFRRHLYAAGRVGPAIKGSTGAELVEGLVIKEGDYKLVKTRFSAFFATSLHSVLQSVGINSLVVTGLQTQNCIRQTIFDAIALDYRSVTVLTDATAAATLESHYGWYLKQIYST